MSFRSASDPEGTIYLYNLKVMDVLYEKDKTKICLFSNCWSEAKSVEFQLKSNPRWCELFIDNENVNKFIHTDNCKFYISLTWLYSEYEGMTREEGFRYWLSRHSKE